jgi:hypothetical protein
MRNKITRTITLLFFVALISAFVGYRSGLTDEFVYKGSSYTRFQPDTLPRNDSTKVRMLMPSSKAMIIPRKRMKSKQRFQSTFKTDSSIIMKRELMGSSKSGVIIKPKVESDSVDKK